MSRYHNRTKSNQFKLVFGVIAFSFGLLIAPVTFSHEVLFIKEANTPFQDKILQSIVNELQSSDKKIVIDSQNVGSITRKQIILKAPDLIITLGSKAAHSQKIATFPVLHTLIPESSYSILAECNKIDCDAGKPIYGLYLDQPVQRQLNLLKLLLPGRRSPGLLTASFSAKKAAEFGLQAKKSNYNLHSALIENEQQLPHQFNKLLEEMDVFIVLPDPLIHNRQTIPHLLLTTYRYNIPVIGFSHAYVNAGAVAAIYSSPEQIAQKIADLIKKILSTNPPPPGNYPNINFEAAINRNVARSLGFNFPDEQTLKAKLLLLEQ